ncbi:VWA domain-containing protein [Candidatus Pacearchaeota archaeon]|nr:VWA domain-containing protein [Candidatus Pacearchaeota archaeon]
MKKAISNLVVIILSILLILALIILLYNILKVILGEQSELYSAKSEIITEEMNIDRIKGDVINPTRINITISKGPGKMVLKNITIIKPKIDIVFLIDSTGSMNQQIISVNNTIANFTQILENSSIDYKLALVEFRDYPEPSCGASSDFSDKTYSFSDGVFTSKLDEYRAEMSKIAAAATGGFDAPEAQLTALDVASNLDYRIGSKRVAVLLTNSAPHAKDCLNAFCYNPNYTCCSIIGCYYTKEKCESCTGTWTISNRSTYVSCYHGPEYIEDVKNTLKNKGITLYYINDNTGLCGNNKDLELSSETGGQFYNYTNPTSVNQIISGLAETIIENYELVKEWDHIRVIFSNETTIYEYKIYDPPAPLESKTYIIPIDKNLSEYITNIKKVEIYAAIITKSGKVVTGPPLDKYEFKLE